jgi:acetyl esterase/lipase
MNVLKNIKYSSPQRCLLDVYSSSSTNCPVIICLHGGAWSLGDKSTVSEISSILTDQKMVVVTPSYRLTTFGNKNIKTLMLIESVLLLMVGYFSKTSEQSFICLLVIFVTLIIMCYSVSKPRTIIKHPTHVRDIVQVIKWTLNNIEQFGGDPTNIFMLGHSAGAHLASLVSTNPMYLREFNMETSVIKGTICISGVFSDKRMKQSTVAKEILTNVFGTHDNYIDAFPIYHIQPNTPPHLLLNATIDYTLKRHTFDMINAFKEKGVYAASYVYPNTNHFNIRHYWYGKNRKVLNDIMKFIYDHL